MLSKVADFSNFLSRYCTSLESLRLEVNEILVALIGTISFATIPPIFHPFSLLHRLEQVDSTDGNSNAGLQEAMAEQNIHTLQNQVNIDEV